MCGHSFHPRHAKTARPGAPVFHPKHAKTARPGAPGFDGMAASGAVFRSTPLGKMALVRILFPDRQHRASAAADHLKRYPGFKILEPV
jgi:hypothetical protein